MTILLTLLLFSAQEPRGTLAKVKGIKCTFPLMAIGTWGKEKPEAKVQPANLVLQLLSASLIQLIKLSLLARLTDASLEAAIGVRMCHEHGHSRRHDARRDRPAANP